MQFNRLAIRKRGQKETVEMETTEFIKYLQNKIQNKDSVL
jgi:hypothetical protein